MALIVECKIINLLLLLHFLFISNNYFKKYLPWLITAASPLSLSLVSFFIVTGYCQTVTINTFWQHYCSWRATPNVTQGIKMFLLYLSTSTSCSLTDGSSIVLADTFDLWLDTLIGSGNFVFSCIILLVSLYNSYSSENVSVFHTSGGFCNFVWTKFTRKPTRHGRANCAVQFFQVRLKVYCNPWCSLWVLQHVCLSNSISCWQKP